MRARGRPGQIWPGMPRLGLSLTEADWARICRQWRRGNLVLLVALTVVTGLAVFRLWRLTRPLEPPAATSALTGPSPAVRSAAAGVGDYRSHIGGRKLFVLPSPGPPTTAVADAIADAKKRLTLCGIANVGGKRAAYFEVEKGGKGTLGLYAEGDMVDDFTVVDVGAGSVVLEVAGQQVTFTM